MTLEAPRAQRSPTSRRQPARSRAPALPAALSRQIARFFPPVRAELRRILRSTERAADLVVVFPAVLHALASNHGDAAARTSALSMIAAGAPLRCVAQTLGLPMWLRRLPPEAFTGALTGLPTDEGFARRVPARLPARTCEAADWLEAVRFATRACHSDFALWVARHRLYPEARCSPYRLVLLAAYAWHSLDSGHAASDLVMTRWRPEMAPDTAICAAKSWFNRIMLCVRLPAGKALDAWLEPGEADGLAFVPLTDCDAVLTEARAMSNCTDQYAAALTRNRCRLFSVRRAGQHVATLEIVPHNRETGVLAIGQLKGRHNAPATLDVWQAAFRWMALQQRLFQMPLGNATSGPDDAAWTALMAPYRAAHKGAHWLPASADDPLIDSIESALALLARDANIRSWLFV